MSRPSPFVTLDRRWRILIATLVRELRLADFVEWLARRVGQ